MEFGVLGTLEVSDGKHHLSVRSIKQRSLLAMLLCHHGTVARSDVLIDALWGPEARRRRRQAPAPATAPAQADPGSGRGDHHRFTGYLLRAPCDAVDAWRFDRLVQQGRRSLAAGHTAKGGDQLREALRLWRGPALSGLSDIPFLHRQATRLEEERLAALGDRLDADLRLRRHADLIGELTVLVREHPLRERFRSQLMVALYRGGRQAEALEVYRDGRRILARDLGLEPSPELRRLEVAILTSDSSLAVSRPAVHRTVHPRGSRREGGRGPSCPHCR